MKKGIVLMLAMAVMALTVACDDGSSEKEKKIRMAIHNKMDTALVKVKGATVGSTNLVDLWDDEENCGGDDGIIPLNPDDAYIYYYAADDNYEPVDLPAGRFTAWYSVVDDNGSGDPCDFGSTSNDAIPALFDTRDGVVDKEVQPTYDLEAGSTYLVVFDEAYSATDYHAIWLKVGDNWEGLRMTEVSE